MALPKCVHLPYLRDVSLMAKIYGLLQLIICEHKCAISIDSNTPINKFHSFVMFSQGSRFRRPSMLNTRYFRFGREFRLSVRPSGHDFYVENISALEANFGWQEA